MYTACHTSDLPAVRQANTSLTRLLRSSQLALPSFFDKIKKWSDMTDLNAAEFLSMVDQLERNFSVSRVIFRKFQTIFNDLFQDSIAVPSEPSRSRKPK